MIERHVRQRRSKWPAAVALGRTASPKPSISQTTRHEANRQNEANLARRGCELGPDQVAGCRAGRPTYQETPCGVTTNRVAARNEANSHPRALAQVSARSARPIVRNEPNSGRANRIQVLCAERVTMSFRSPGLRRNEANFRTAGCGTGPAVQTKPIPPMCGGIVRNEPNSSRTMRGPSCWPRGSYDCFPGCSGLARGLQCHEPDGGQHASRRRRTR